MISNSFDYIAFQKALKQRFQRLDAEVKDLGKQFVTELEEFFVNYHQLSGKKYRVIDVKGPGEAAQRIQAAIRAARKK